MSVSAGGLRDEILNAFAALTDEQQANTTVAHATWASAIQGYLTDNLEVSGTYVGVLPPPAVGPDPLSGDYVWSVAGITILGATLQAAAIATGFTGWVSGINAGIKLGLVAGQDSTGVITLTASSLFTTFTFSVVQDDLKGFSSMEDVVEAIAAKIVEGFTAYLSVPATGLTTTTASGTGVTTITSID